MLSKLVFTTLVSSVLAEKDGISFVVIGDFAKISDMTNANKVFDEINRIKATATPDAKENFDFFVTTGDNLYVAGSQFDPQPEEFEAMMNLFLQRNSIKDLPIYPVRGNHDCMFKEMFIEP